MAQGKIIIDTEIEIDKSEKKLNKLKRDVENAGDSISDSFDIDVSKLENQFKRAKLSVEDLMGRVKNTEFLISELNNLDTEILNFEREKQELKEWEESARAMHKAQKIDNEALEKDLQLISDGYDKIETSIIRVQDEMKSIGTIGNLTEQLDKQETQLERARLSYENLGFNADRLGLRVENAFNKSQAIEEARIKAQQLEDEMAKIAEEAETVADETKEIPKPIEKATQSTVKLDSTLKGVDKSAKSVSTSTSGMSSGIDKGIKKLVKYGLALFSIRSVYQSLRNLSNKWLQSDDLGAQQVKSNLEAITNAMANGLAPVITYISGLVVQLFGYFNAILKAFFGIDLMGKKLTKNTNNTNKGAKKVTNELKKWTGQFDKADIASENIADNMDSASGSGGMDLPEAKIPTPDISGIIKAFDKIKKSFLDIWNSKQFQSVLNSLKTIFGNVMNSIISIASNAFDSILGIWEVVLPHLIRGFENMANFYALTLSDIANFTDEWLPIITESFNTLVTSIYDTLTPLYEFMAQLWADIWEIILELWQEHGADLLSKFGELVTNVLKIFDKLWALIDTIITPIIDVLKNVWNDTLKDMLKEAGAFILEMWGYGMDLYNKFIAPIVGFLLDTLQPIWATVFGTMGGIVTGVINSVVSTITIAIQTIRGVINGLIDFIAGVFTGDWERAWKGVSKIFDTVWEGIKSAFKIPFNFIIDGINGFIRGVNKIKIPDWVPGVGGKGFSIAQIPRLAKGGVLRQETLNIAGEYAGARTNPEIVTPQNIMRDTMESVLKGMNLGGGGSEVINLIWNNEKLATAQIDYEQTKGIQMNGGMTYEFI